MSGKDVRAGGAFIEILAKANVAAGLKAAGAQVTQWGKSLGAAGLAMVGASTAVLAPLGAMALEFAETGSTLNDMSARTGMSAEALSGLGYAAQMTGADLDTVETANKKIGQALAEAAAGTQSARDKFDGLGLDWRAMLAESPDDWLAEVADGMQNVTNPAQRTAAALDLMGKSGTNLIPMLSDGAAGLADMAATADRLGLVMSNSDAAAADELGDAWDNVTGSLKGVRMQIGAALAPALTDLATKAADIGATVVTWTRENRGLFVGLAAGAVALGAVGSAIMLAGGAVAALGLTLTALGTIAATVASLVVSPFALLAAGAYAWANYTTSGQNAVNATGAALADLGTTAQTTLGGISDALSTGDLGAAADIALAGLYVAWLRGLQLVEELTGSRLALILELLGSGRFADAAGLAWEEIKAAALTGWADLQAELATVSAGLGQLWDEAAASMKTAWRGAIFWIAEKIIWLVDNTANSLDLLGKAFKRFEGLGDSIRLGPAVLDTLKADQTGEDKQRAADLAAQTEARGLALAATHKRLEEDKADIAARRAKIETDLAATTAGHGADQLATAQADLAAKTAAAKTAKDAATAAKTAKDKKKADGHEADDSGPAFTAGTFSAAGALALAQGGNSKDEEIADNTAETAAQVRDLRAELAPESTGGPVQAQIAATVAAYAQPPALALDNLRPPAAAFTREPSPPELAVIAANTAATAAACAALASGRGPGLSAPPTWKR